MKVKFTYDNPIDRQQRITKSFFIPHTFFNSIKELMARSNEGSLIILPVEIEVEYNDETTESTTIFVSTLCEKNNNRINKLKKPVPPQNVTVTEGCTSYGSNSKFRTAIRYIIDFLFR